MYNTHLQLKADKLNKIQPTFNKEYDEKINNKTEQANN